jgi:hypothetical protein
MDYDNLLQSSRAYLGSMTPAKTLTTLAFAHSRGHIPDRVPDGAIAATIAVLYTIY